jgi:serine/threonine-protein kinase RsbW/stage II sporulation protein AB (anti-sigma F factor)
LSPEDCSAIEADRTRPFIELELSAQPESIAAARRAVVELARLDHLSEAAISDVALAVSEAASNVVLHAYRGARRPGPMLVRAELTDQTLEVEVRDHGVGMRPRRDSPGLGLGLPLIGTLASSVEVDSGDDRQTCVRMRFHRSDMPSSFF